MLEERGSPLDSADALGRRPIHNASDQGRTECVSFLLEKVFPLLLPPPLPRTIVYRPLPFPSIPSPLSLQQQGVDPSSLDNYQASSAHKAASNGHTSVLRLLSDHKAPLNGQDHEGITPLSYAVRHSHRETVEYLMDVGKGEEVEVADLGGSKCVHEAAQLKDQEILKILLGEGEVGRGVNAVDGSGMTPLHRAALGKSAGCIKVLLDRGANMQAVFEGEVTALHLAAKKGAADCVRQLALKGCDVNLRDKRGRTPLHYAVKSGVNFSSFFFFFFFSLIFCLSSFLSISFI